MKMVKAINFLFYVLSYGSLFGQGTGFVPGLYRCENEFGTQIFEFRMDNTFLYEYYSSHNVMFSEGYYTYNDSFVTISSEYQYSSLPFSFSIDKPKDVPLFSDSSVLVKIFSEHSMKIGFFPYDLVAIQINGNKRYDFYTFDPVFLVDTVISSFQIIIDNTNSGLDHSYQSEVREILVEPGGMLSVFVEYPGMTQFCFNSVQLIFNDTRDELSFYKLDFVEHSDGLRQAFDPNARFKKE